MDEKLEAFLKIIVFSFAVCRSSSAQHTKFNCLKVVDKNSSIICESSSNENSILPVEDIPHDINTLIIKTSGNGSLALTRADIFQNFKHLQNLQILISRGPYVTEKLLDSVSINDLEKVLFDIPTLKTLSLKYNEFNVDRYSWMLPANLEKLYLSNGVFEFDLLNCPHLVSVRLYRNKLNKIPSFRDPLPSLEVLDLRHNPLNEFTVNDIAALCNLKYYAMDTSYITNCECNKLKQWVIKLQKLENFTFNGSLNCNDTIGSYSNCTLEEATLRREKCSKAWTWNNKAILIAAVPSAVATTLIITCCFFCCCCLCLMIWSTIPFGGYHVPVYAPAPYAPYSPYSPYQPFQPYPAVMPVPVPVPVPGIGFNFDGPSRDGSRPDGGGYGGRGGDDFYSGENDAPDNADNDQIFGVTICDKGVSQSSCGLLL